MNRNYDAVLFDAGQTLLWFEGSVGGIYAEVAGRYGVQADPEALDAAFRAIWEQQKDALDLGTSEAQEWQWWLDLVDAVFQAVGKRQAFGDAFDPFFRELHGLFSETTVWRVFDDAVPALTELQRLGIRCAVVSNWDSRLPLLLERLDLLRWFECVITSAQVGCRKPNARIFEVAALRLEMPAARLVHVGDSYEEDMLGAQAAGITPLLIDRAGRHGAAPGVIRTLLELPARLSG